MKNNPINNIPVSKRGNPAWKPGVSGNPAGRKHKPDCIVSLLKDLLLEPSRFEHGKTNEQVISEKIIEMASAGNPKMIEILMDRIYGRVPLPVQSQVSGEVRIRIIEE
jgi:hypothetical protein